MTLDSVTVAYIGTILSYSPSWSLVTLFLMGGLIYFLINLIKNTELTKKIFTSMDVVHEIRKDQILSNEERVQQGKQIKEIIQRVDAIEQDIEHIRCTRTGCNNREK